MSKNSSSLIYIVDLLTRNCELVWLPLQVNAIIYWWYVSQGHPEMDFSFQFYSVLFTVESLSSIYLLVYILIYMF